MSNPSPTPYYRCPICNEGIRECPEHGESPYPRKLTKAAVELLERGEYQDRDGSWHAFTLDRWRRVFGESVG